MAIWTKKLEILWAIILPISVNMLHLEWNKARRLVDFVPAAFFALVSAQADKVSANATGDGGVRQNTILLTGQPSFDVRPLKENLLACVSAI